MIVQLDQDVALLLLSIEGDSAFKLLLPLIREVALAVAGKAPIPKLLEPLPDLRSAIALERARYKAANGQAR